MPRLFLLREVLCHVTYFSQGSRPSDGIQFAQLTSPTIFWLLFMLHRKRQAHNNHLKTQMNYSPSSSSTYGYHSRWARQQMPSRKITKPTSSDVLCGRGGYVNAHEGNVRFRDRVYALKSEYFSEKTRKLDKAKITQRIVDQVHSLQPPGRFLKQDPSTKSWVEISDEKAKKKVGQAFRDTVAAMERTSQDKHEDDDEHVVESSIVAGTCIADMLAPSTKRRASTPSLPPLPSSLEQYKSEAELEAEENHRPTSPADSSTDSPRIEMNVDMQQQQPLIYTGMRNSPPAKGDTHTNTLQLSTSNEEPLTLREHDAKLVHKVSRIPIAEFALYRNANNSAAESIKDGGEGEKQDKSNSDAVSAASDLEKATVDMLVKRARIWEDMYYSEREYSRKLEGHLVAVLGSSSQLPKRRRVGSNQSDEEGLKPLAA